MQALPPQPGLTGQLIAALRHSNPNVRAGAAESLGRLKELEAAEPLFEALGDPVHRVQQAAVRAIGMLGAPVVGELLARIQDVPQGEIQNRLAEALGQICDPEAVEILSAALNYLEPPARYGAAEALGAMRDERAIPALIQAIRDPDIQTRQRAAVSLLEIGAEEAIHGLSALLDEEDPRLRQVAVEGLGRIGTEPASLTLLTALNDEDESVRQAAASALRSTSRPELKQVLLTALNSPVPFVQQAIAETLANYPGDEVRERLLELMNAESDLETRLFAAQSLARLGDERGRTMILRTLNAPNVETRMIAAIALGLTGDGRAVGPLIDAVRVKPLDPGKPRSRLLRRRILRALQACSPGNIPAIIALSFEQNQGLRALGEEALVRIGSEAVPHLIRVIQIPGQAHRRIRAARLLGQIGDVEAAGPLSVVLRETLIGPYPVVFLARLFYDPNAALRAEAAAALGKIESADGASLLLSAARFDPDPRVNAAAERSLSRSGSPAVIARFAEADVLGFVNRALASALGMLLVGFFSGAASRLWGIEAAALIAGLAAGGALGAVDGLEGGKPAVRGALLGSLAALLLGYLPPSAAALPPWGFTVLGAALPAIGALAGLNRQPLLQRAAGFFGGMVLGFVGAGLAALILGTIA